MKTYLDCIPCFLDQALRASRIATSNQAIQQKTLKLVLKRLSTLPMEVTPPEIAKEVYGVVSETTGNSDPYAEIKRQSNRLALSLYPRLKNTVINSENPLFAACKLAISGNSIDFGPREPGDIQTEIESALLSDLAIDHFEAFKKALEKATRILYLGDNAGEIVFDKLLIGQLQSEYPAKITYVVRETPIINDATYEDAVDVGLTEVVEVISNGSNEPATVLKNCSAELRRLFDTSELIISKGQGNFESLGGVSDKIFFLLKVKCNLVSRQLNVQTGNMVLINGTHLR